MSRNFLRSWMGLKMHEDLRKFPQQVSISLWGHQSQANRTVWICCLTQALRYFAEFIHILLVNGSCGAVNQWTIFYVLVFNTLLFWKKGANILLLNFGFGTPKMHWTPVCTNLVWVWTLVCQPKIVVGICIIFFTFTQSFDPSEVSSSGNLECSIRRLLCPGRIGL